MTPTEQDKELREKLNSHFESVFSQGVRAGKDVATETYEDFGAWRKGDELDEIMKLITADRKRVALEARIDENEAWCALGRMIDPREFVAEIGRLELKKQELEKL